jgi:hypothetical protein
MKSLLIVAVVLVLSASTVAVGQLIDRTKAPNTSGDGISMPLMGVYPSQIGDGRSGPDPNASRNVIALDPFRAIRRGRQLFQRKFTRLEGLGSTGDGSGNIELDITIGAGFADSCAACHGRPHGSAGFGGDVVTRPDSRDAPHLFGLGLKEMLADEITGDLRAIRAAAVRRAAVDREPARRPVAVLAAPVFDAGDPRVTRSKPTSSDWSRTRAAAPSGSMSETYYLASRAVARLEDADGRAGLARLPFSRDEANAIGLLAGILSLVNDRGAPQDGLLRLHDIFNMRLNADLVVLSACQTALGKEINGEGLVGLTRGFMYAGAPRVVASLWQVSDVATAELMKKFYAGMPQKRLPASAALRRAQLEIARDPRWASPCFWAGFVLQGDWR